VDDMERQALNVVRMRLLGAEVIGVDSGSRTLKDAINEAMRDWVTNVTDTYYILGSVLGPHPYPLMVREFQSVIGREARSQILDQAGRLPDAVVACVGGGSNAMGIFDGFIPDRRVRLIGVEAGGRGIEPGQHAARFAGGAAGVYTGDLARLAQLGTILSLLKYSRTLEAEADAMGLKLISEAGLRPMAMSETWDQLIGELDASAYYRRRRRERRINLFETHPSPDARRAEMKLSAAEVTVPGKVYDDGHARYVRAIGPLRPMLLDDQVKLNDPGASHYIINTLANDGWNGLLRFYEAEIWRLRSRGGDDFYAAQGYAAAVQYPDAPADAWRWHGLMLQKSGRIAEARNAYNRYLAMAPNAPDAPFIRQQLQQ